MDGTESVDWAGSRHLGASERARQERDTTSDAQISLLIADDHVLLAEAVASALAAPPRSYTSQIVSTLDETLVALSTEDRYDLVLLDIKMPGMIGLKSVKDVIDAAKPVRVVLLSGNADMSMVKTAVGYGARGLIPKTLSLKSLASVVEFVLSGQVFLPVTTGALNNGDSDDGQIALTEGEAGVLRLTSEGLTNKEIAYSVGSTEVKIKMHMRAICRKLNARNRAHAVTVGKELGLL